MSWNQQMCPFFALGARSPRPWKVLVEAHQEGSGRQSKEDMPPEKSYSCFDQHSAPSNDFVTSYPQVMDPTLRYWIRRVHGFDETSPFSHIYYFYGPNNAFCMCSFDNIQIILCCVYHALHAFHTITNIQMNINSNISEPLLMNCFLIDNFTDIYSIAPERPIICLDKHISSPRHIKFATEACASWEITWGEEGGRRSCGSSTSARCTWALASIVALAVADYRTHEWMV